MCSAGWRYCFSLVAVDVVPAVTRLDSPPFALAGARWVAAVTARLLPLLGTPAGCDEGSTVVGPDGACAAAVFAGADWSDTSGAAALARAVAPEGRAGAGWSDAN